MYLAEKRIQDETIIPNDTLRGACANCHPLARPLSWRRSPEDWKLLANLHVALYPQADEAFRLGINAGGFGDHEKPGDVLPVDEALGLFKQDRAASHSRVGRLAGPNARSETGRPLAGERQYSRPRQILRRTGSGTRRG